MQFPFLKYWEHMSRTFKAEPNLLLNKLSTVVSTLLRFQFCSHLRMMFICLSENHRHLGTSCLLRTETACGPKVESDGDCRDKFKEMVLKIVLEVTQ